MITKYKVGLPNEPILKDYIKFFKAIPADEWCIDVLQNDEGKRCALGHINAFYTGDGLVWANYRMPVLGHNVVNINNGYYISNVKKRHKGIKTRVINYLKSLLTNSTSTKPNN